MPMLPTRNPVPRVWRGSRGISRCVPAPEKINTLAARPADHYTKDGTHMSLFDLTDKVAIVTGSSRGIGRAIALRMAEQGARVVIAPCKQQACLAVGDG